MTVPLTSHFAANPEVMARALRALVSPDTILRANEKLAKRTTFRVGGPADLYLEPASEADLSNVLRFCRANHVPILVLGRGSNLLVKDQGFRGAVISLAHPVFGSIAITHSSITCGAGVKLKSLAVTARNSGLAGFEFLEGIPGTLGGALRMNAGAMGSSVFDRVKWVRFIDEYGTVHQSPPSEMAVGYRRCLGLVNGVAVSAGLEGICADPKEIEERMKQFSERRWNTQPAAPSAGCIFKNPDCIAAGRLVDELGLKGHRVGGAVVSREHGNFIVNDGNATASDILQLIEVVRQQAWVARKIALETEVQIVGE